MAYFPEDEIGTVTKEAVAARLKFFAFDSDGCLFPNTVWEGVTVEVGGKDVGFNPKVRSYYDGQDMSLIRAIGLRVCVITNEKDANATGVRHVVEKWNNLPSSKNGTWPIVELFEGCGGRRKLETLSAWLIKHGGALSECGAMGDDLVDVPMLQQVAFRAAPSSAEELVRNICHFVSTRPGGEGAVRDLANFLVKVRGLNPFDLPFD